MKQFFLLCVLLLLVIPLGGCGADEMPIPADSDDGQATEQPQDSPDSASEGSDETGDVTDYGANLASMEGTSLTELLADKEAFIGETIQVSGTVVGVCAKRGCWINIGAGEGEQVRFKVADGEMVFPMSAKGSAVTAQGVWTKMVTSVEDLRKMKAEHAAEAGEEFDPASVTEPHISWQLKGLGAKIDA